MNIFYLDQDPKTCAEMHVDKHVCKMVIEYAQLMCTTHRVLDGQMYIDKTKNNRIIKRWRLDDDRELRLMKPTMMNHPSAIWLRQSDKNYVWLYQMWCELLKEFTYRYGKVHATARLIPDLARLPDNITIGEFTGPIPAMPDDCKVPGNSLQSYHNYYATKKEHLWSWKGKINGRQEPKWLTSMIKSLKPQPNFSSPMMETV
jgi:hypothetical protein